MLILALSLKGYALDLKDYKVAISLTATHFSGISTTVGDTIHEDPLNYLRAASKLYEDCASRLGGAYSATNSLTGLWGMLGQGVVYEWHDY